MSKKIMFGVLALALVAVLAPAALAQPGSLVAVGPIVPYVAGPPASGNGYPLYIEDINGVRVDLPAPPILNGTLLNPLAPSMVFDEPIDGNQFSQDIGFGSEAFYYIAQADFDMGGGNRAVLVLGVEAAFGAGDALNGDQLLFVRSRIRVDTPQAGTYTITHPWGTEVFRNVPAGRRAINFTFDWISLTPGFDRILLSPRQGPFLRATTMAPGVSPLEWLGDGVTQSTLDPASGGLNNNEFRIVGPGLPAGGAVTNLFMVSGHLFTAPVPPPPPPPPPGTPTPLTVDRAIYSGNARTFSADVFATSTPTSTATVSIDGRPAVPMTNDGTGKLFAHVPPLNTVLIPPLAATVIATDAVTGTVATTLVKPLVDGVDITLATYTVGTQTLRVRATSTDRSAPRPVLTAVGFPTPLNNQGRLTVSPVAVPPAEVTVISTKGGKASHPVTILP